MESKIVEFLLLVVCVLIQTTLFIGYIGVLVLKQPIQKTFPSLKESMKKVTEKSKVSKYKVLSRITISYFLSIMGIQMFVGPILSHNWYYLGFYLFIVDSLFLILIPFLVYFILKGKKEHPYIIT